MQMIFKNEEICHVRHAYDEHPDPDQFPMHMHGHYEILFFISGDITYLVEGNTYRPTPGDIMIFNIAETHKVVVNSDTPYERIVIQMERNVVSAMDSAQRLFSPFFKRGLGQSNVLHPQNFQDGFWESCIRRIAEVGDDRLKMLSYLLPLLNEICTAFDRHARATVGDTLSSRVVNYINDRISEPFKPEAIARTFLISRTALYVLFKEATGSSIHAYIHAKRLLMARELLLRGAKPSEVYLSCGFHDYTTFFRAYKAKFGVSPKNDIKRYSDV